MSAKNNTDPKVDERVITLLETALREPTTDPVYLYLSDERERSDLSLSDWLHPLKASRGELCLSFPSGNGAHYVRYRPDHGFKAVYAGPNGPENRPADIESQNLKRLLRIANDVLVVSVQNTPFSALEVSGDA